MNGFDFWSTWRNSIVRTDSIRSTDRCVPDLSLNAVIGTQDMSDRETGKIAEFDDPRALCQVRDFSTGPIIFAAGKALVDTTISKAQWEVVLTDLFHRNDGQHIKVLRDREGNKWASPTDLQENTMNQAHSMKAYHNNIRL